MKAVVYKGKNIFILEDRPAPEIINETDAIIKVTLTSICSSDLHIKNGAVPKAVSNVIVGHEMVGIVEKIGKNVKKVKQGDRVAINVETFCGECFYCEKGSVNNCIDFYGGWSLGCRIDGGQAEYVRVLYADNCLNKIPDSVTDKQALFTGDILSTGYWSALISEIKPEDTIAVIGAGPTGLCTMACAKLYNPKNIIAIDIDSNRLKLAKEQKWADIIIDAKDGNIGQEILNITNGRGADVVMEVAGAKDSFQTAWQIARPGGIVCVIAMYEESQILPLPEMYGKNLTFKTGGVDACHCDEILKLIEQGKLDVTSLITHDFYLDDIMRAYDYFETRKDNIIKVAVHV